MFFALSKIGGFFALPSNLFFVLAFIGVALTGTRLARCGRRMVVVAVLLLGLAGLSPLGNALMLPLCLWGNGSVFSNRPPEGQFVLPLLQSFGIAAGRIELESASRETFENATMAKALIRPVPGQRWLLVTSAFHMPRAVGSFRRVGFAVEFYPVDWQIGGAADLLSPFQAESAGLVRTDVAIHEWTGLLIYWMTGRTSALFPAPAALRIKGTF